MSQRVAEAVALVLSEQCFVSDSVQGVHLDVLEEAKSNNVYGTKTQISTQVQTESSGFSQKATSGLSTVFLSLEDLVVLLPQLFTFLTTNTPIVFAANATNATDLSALSVLSQSGVTCLYSSESELETQTVSLTAHVVAAKYKIPVVHFYSVNSNPGAKAIPLAELVKGDLEQVFKTYLAEKNPKDVVPKKTTQFTSENLAEVLQFISDHLSKIPGHSKTSITQFCASGNSSAKVVVVAFGVDTSVLERVISSEKIPVAVVKAHLTRPWSNDKFLAALPANASSVCVLESPSDSGFSTLYFDVVASLSSRNTTEPPKIINVKYSQGISSQKATTFLRGLVDNKIERGVEISDHKTQISEDKSKIPQIVSVGEEAYLKLLTQVLRDRLFLVNVSGYTGKEQTEFVTPTGTLDYGYGKILSHIQSRKSFTELVVKSVVDGSLSEQLKKELKNWIDNKDDPKKINTKSLEDLLSKEQKSSELAQKIYAKREFFPKKSYWLIGNDRWVRDIGNSGIHNIISSGENINVLLIDSETYSVPVPTSPVPPETSSNSSSASSSADQQQSRGHKKDIGLYAMMYGTVYTASTALYSSYTQSFTSIIEADNYKGVAVVLGLAPFPKITDSNNNNNNNEKKKIHSRNNSNTSNSSNVNEEDKVKALHEESMFALKETKVAVDSGKWPLYRWNPEKEEKFTLDSEKLKLELQEFLKREQHLSLLVQQNPWLENSLEENFVQRHVARHTTLMESFEKLSNSLSGKTYPPILILYGSDGGNAENIARRLESRGKARGVPSKCIAANDYLSEHNGDVSVISKERTVVFVISTAGQGEFPANSKEFWKALCNISTTSTNTFGDTQFAVFSMGDRNYWPRENEKIYFCKAGKDLDAKLGAMGAYRLVECGIGDDQDEDGFETGFKAWEPKLWLSLNVGGSDDKEETKKVRSDDEIKKSSNFLRGNLIKNLADETTGSLPYEDTKLTKFHGIYQQDDRDLREERRKAGQEKAFSFMVRVRVPGGVCTPKQWVDLDTISDKHCNGTIKITTRQAIQFHGILKRNLKKSIQDINKTLMDTIAACGDVSRNVMCSSIPFRSKIHEECFKFSQKFSAHLTPATGAYHEVWLDKKQVAGEPVQDEEPLYGPTYLPRKFKVAIAVPPYNDVDVHAHCLGFVAIEGKDGSLLGFNITIGGGMGMTHNNKKTYPCLAQVMGFAPLDKCIDVGEKVMLVQRDFGDRSNRKHARLKYTLEDRGMDWYREEVEKRCGFKLEPPKDHVPFANNNDTYGWTKGTNGKWYYTLFVEHGRVRDTHNLRMKTALKNLAEFQPPIVGEFIFTPNQHIIIGAVEDQNKPKIEEFLKGFGIDNGKFTGLRLSSVACVALPTCGLAFAESERYLPHLVTLLEDAVIKAGLKDDSINIRSSGCPNGCSRPYLGEIALVGRSPGIYNLYLGAAHNGTRMNKLYKEALNEEQIISTVSPIISRYALERKSRDESFGDFVIRAGIIKATIAGRDFHDQ